MPRAQDAQDAYREVGGTIPWMESVESSLEQRPRKRLEHVFERRVIGKIVFCAKF